MKDVITTLILIYLGIMVINLLFSITLYRGTKQNVFKLNIMLWTSLIFLFIVQGYLQFSERVIAYSLLALAPFIYTQLLTYQKIMKLDIKLKPLLTISIPIAIIGVSLSMFNNISFKVYTFFISISVTYPLLKMATQYLRSKTIKNKSFFKKGYSILLIGFSFHLLDYPFFRLDSNMAVFGYSLAMAFVLGFSIFSPIIANNKVQSFYERLLTNQVESKTKELRKQNDLLKETFQYKDNLVRILCHDLNNTINVMKLGSKMLSKKVCLSSLNEAEQEKILHYNKKVSRAINTQEKMVDSVREMEAVTSGKKKMSLSLTSLKDVFDQSYFIFKDQLKAKKLTIDYTIEDQVDTNAQDIHILADPVYFSNVVFNNLISNAIKFTNGSTQIKVTATRLIGGSVKIAIEDKGIGIPSDILPILFDPDKRTSRLGTSGEKGTGFGMPLVKDSLKLFNASIKVVTKDINNFPTEHGTKFIMEFDKVA